MYEKRSTLQMSSRSSFLLLHVFTHSLFASNFKLTE
mgnify:CR=1 FL=1